MAQGTATARTDVAFVGETEIDVAAKTSNDGTAILRVEACVHGSMRNIVVGFIGGRQQMLELARAIAEAAEEEWA